MSKQKQKETKTSSTKIDASAEIVMDRPMETVATLAPHKRRHLSYEGRKAVWGYIFISPWLIGVIVFFVVPMAMAAVYTFTKISVDKNGFNFEWVGLQNYFWALREEPTFVKDNLVPSIMNMLWQVPIIVFFSVFVAMMIKEKFFGRTLARAIFFLPVIVASGVVLGILKKDILGGAQIGDTAGQAAYMFKAPSFADLFSKLGVPGDLVTFITSTVNQVFDLTWKSGVQILLLLAAINNVPASSYEVADMEGATAWEKFWKITFPMISPTLLVTIIYSIIDSFTDFQNLVMKQMMTLINDGKYDQGTTIAFIYFVCVLVFIGIVNGIVSRKVFYYNE